MHGHYVRICIVQIGGAYKVHALPRSRPRTGAHARAHARSTEDAPNPSCPETFRPKVNADPCLVMITPLHGGLETGGGAACVDR